MNVRDQGFQPTRTMAGLPLGAVVGPAKRVAAKVCKVHTWKQSKYTRTCTRCGVTEDKS